jgi:tRNA(Ile)-lysidine synthase
MPLLTRLTESLRGLDALEPGGRFLLACSAGLDSTVCAHLFGQLAEKWKLGVTLAHVHHGLREEADLDLEFVRSLASNLKLNFVERRVDVPSSLGQGGNTQAVARKLRYEALEEMRHEADCRWTVTAHHADDQAETLLAHLVRGTGPAGLAGIRAKLGNVIRPLLFASRKELHDFALQEGLSWREDSSNNEDHYTRNAIRHHVMPVINEWAGNLAATAGDTARVFASLDEYLSSHIDGLMKECVQWQGKSCAFAVQPLKRYFEFEQLLLIHTVLAAIAPAHATISASYSIRSLLDAATGREVPVGNVYVAVRDRDFIRIDEAVCLIPCDTDLLPGRTIHGSNFVFESDEVQKEMTEFSRDPSIEYIDLDVAGNGWTLRRWRHGDRFRPFGMDGSRLVSDFLTGLRLSPFEKRNAMVLENDTSIIWVCGHRLDDRYRVRPETRRVCRLAFHNKQESA